MRQGLLWIGCICTLLSCVLFSCDSGNPDGISAKNKTPDWRLTLASDDKRPYGSYIAHQSLKRYFPAAEQKDLRRTFRYTGIGSSMASRSDSASLFIMLGFDLYMTDDEWAKVLAFASSGNEILIFSSRLDPQVYKYFGFLRSYGPDEEARPPKYVLAENRDALRLESDTTKLYGYTGRHIRSSFAWESGEKSDPDYVAPAYNTEDAEVDTNEYLTRMPVPEVLGRTKGAVNFMRYNVGLGNITFHAAPLVMSNYFLLQPGNRAYLDSIWHTLPANISKVYWNEYYIRRADRSDFGVLWRHPATRAALLLFLLGMLLYVLFSMERRQRIIPIVKPVENTSVQFVETIGRLYYNQGVHGNLAEKMAQHFLEWVRSVYYIDTTLLNDAFETSLAAKSGLPAGDVHRVTDMLRQARNGTPADENYLYQFHSALQKFYSRHPHSLL